MAWLVSKALMENLESSRYLPEQEAESSAENCLDGEPSAQLKSTPTAQAYLYSDKTTAFSRLSRYGMTLKIFTGEHGAELLTWFLEGFHAKTLAQPDAEMESTVREADSGEKWRGSLAKYDRASRLWKTAQCSLLEDLAEMGYDAMWGVISAENAGAPHKRERLWIVAYSVRERVESKKGRNLDGEILHQIEWEKSANSIRRPNKWSSEPNFPRVAYGIPNRLDRHTAAGNGQVPIVARIAWEILSEGIAQ